MLLYKWIDINNPTILMDSQCLQEITDNNQTIMYKSGHFFAQLGLWDDCTDDPNYSYYLANFINNRTMANSSIVMGMCLPSICDKNQVQ